MANRTILWTPANTLIRSCHMTSFRNTINERYSLNLKNYAELYDWSVTNISELWEELWQFTGIVHSKPYRKVVSNMTAMPGAEWFPGARLNFAENLLRFNDDHTAIIDKIPGQHATRITYTELREKVRKTAAYLKQKGVGSGDRVAGIVSNTSEAVIAMLAATSLGAVWSSCSPDFGVKGIIDRFSQIQPKVLFAVNGYTYKGKPFSLQEKVTDVVRQLPELASVVIIEKIEESSLLETLRRCDSFQAILDSTPPYELVFKQVPFNHPLYIMYSSGTTGKPKSIVHSAGGTLIQHLKELMLHTDIHRSDTLFYFTTCGWMMWNWMVSALALGAAIVCYDESPFYPEKDSLWKLIDELDITVFGTSAKYIATCQTEGLVPRQCAKLTSLRAILSTGSTLSDESFDYVYASVKREVMLSSISGGTDIVSCFALGNPTLPVIRGELQCRGLGMAVTALDETGKEIIGEKGELVCKKTFPSMPVYFWNDPNNERFLASYFERYPGIWAHGDFMILTPQGGVRIIGRSDTTLNPGGVRIGTAEIYSVVEALPEISDSLVIGQTAGDDEHIILFVKLKEGVEFTEALSVKIKNNIRLSCTPRHVPAQIIQVPDIPYTISGKKVELAVKKIFNGDTAITNRDALANPESLEFFRKKTA